MPNLGFSVSVRFKKEFESESDGLDRDPSGFSGRGCCGGGAGGSENLEIASILGIFGRPFGRRGPLLLFVGDGFCLGFSTSPVRMFPRKSRVWLRSSVCALATFISVLITVSEQ